MFTIFWERDATSEQHGTPVHIPIIISHHHYLLLYFSFRCNTISPLRLTFVNSKAGEIDNLSVLIGSKVICVMCAGPGQVNNLWFVTAPLFACHLLVVSGILLVR